MSERIRYRSDLPPRLRNWKEGTPQVGVFLRTRKGTTVTAVNDKGSDRQETLIYAFLMDMGASTIPDEIMGPLTAHMDAFLKGRR